MKPSDEKHGCCFRCKIADLTFTFNGGGEMNSRGAFHERTNAEVEREIVEGAKRTGTTISKIPERRWV